MNFYFTFRDGFPVFFVGLEMMTSQLPFPIQSKSELNDSENVRDKINIENKRRLKGDLCVSGTIIYDKLFELMAWNEVQPSESELFRLQFWFEDSTAFKHLITVHDIKAVAPDSHVSLFLVPYDMQKHDILKSEEQRCLIKAVPDTSCRLIVVCVGPNLKHEKTKGAIMTYFKYLLDWLEPVTCSTEIPAWIRFLGHSHIKEARKKSKTSSPLPLLTGASSPLQAAASSVRASTSSSGVATVLSSHIASLAAQTAPESTMLVSSEGADVEKEDVSGINLLVEMPYDTSLAAQTPPESTMLVSSKGVDVEKEDVSESNLLVEMPYDTSLAAQTPPESTTLVSSKWVDVEKQDVSGSNLLVEMPYDTDLKSGCHQIRKEWNALRPTENCAELIHGILKAVVKLKQKGLINGYLDDSSNYKLSFSKEFDKGILRNVVNVYFVHRKEEIDIDRNSHEWDMKSVIRMVFDVILEGVTLPRIWQSLYNLIDEIVDETAYSLLDADYKNRHLLAIQDYYCCWNWKDRVSLYDRFWSVLKWGSKTSDELRPVVRWIVRDLNRRILRQQNRWHCDIPLDSPWRRLFDAQNIGDTAYQQLRYIRTLVLHYKELNADGTKRYFKEDETIDDNDEYVELLVCEFFYPFVDSCCLAQPFCPETNLLLLNFLVDENMESAIRIVDLKGVNKISAKLSGRTIFQAPEQVSHPK
ncbi:hypothetical protein OROHE_009731 [Orobanche hederae]